MAPDHKARPDIPGLGRTNWLWTLIMGIVMLVGGVLALLNPLAASLTASAIAALAFIIAGAIQVWLAFRDETHGHRAVAGILGLLLLVFGVLLLAQPLAGLLSLTILVASFFLATGILRIVLALRLRGDRVWGWMLASGLLSAALGLYIFFALPEAALTILGVLLAVELLMSGAALSALALRARAG